MSLFVKGDTDVSQECTETVIDFGGSEEVEEPVGGEVHILGCNGGLVGITEAVERRDPYIIEDLEHLCQGIPGGAVLTADLAGYGGGRELHAAQRHLEAEIAGSFAALKQQNPQIVSENNILLLADGMRIRDLDQSSADEFNFTK